MLLILTLTISAAAMFYSCAAKKVTTTAKPETPEPSVVVKETTQAYDQIAVTPGPNVMVKETTQTYDEQDPFVMVEEMPVFPGGESEIMKYLNSNVKYPEAAKAANVTGRVIVKFCVTSIGNINKVSIVSGLTPETDAEAMRVVSSLPPFMPGKQGGKAVSVWFMVPVNFHPDLPPPPPPPPPAIN